MDNGYSKLIFTKACDSFREAFAATGGEIAVIGLSGGIDSSLAAVIASEAIGPKNVRSYFLPYKTSSSDSASDAMLLAETFKIPLKIVEITPIADVVFALNNCDDLLRRGNIMSRLRMSILFDKSAEHSGIVIGTSNKTEILLGYGTWFGDTASSINPIGELYKRDIVSLSTYAGVPDRIINKPPTADLWKGQTDEEDLGFNYADADMFLYSALELGMGKPDLEELFGAELVSKIVSRVVKNSFKRRMPFICPIFEHTEPLCMAEEVFERLI